MSAALFVTTNVARMPRPQMILVFLSLPVAFHCCQNGTMNGPKNAVKRPSGLPASIALMYFEKSFSSKGGSCWVRI